MPTVSRSRLDAPLPKSAMAGVTKPKIISGIRKRSSWSNRALKVVKIRTPQAGMNKPKAIPKAMAISTRTKRGIRGILMGLTDVSDRFAVRPFHCPTAVLNE